MIRSFFYFLKLIAYWMIFFTLYRVIFLLIYPGRIPEGKTSEALMVFLYALRLDASTITYLIMIPLILWAIQQFAKQNFLNRINHFYNLGMISAITVVCISNIVMYGIWNDLLNFHTLFYFVSLAKIFPYLTTLHFIGIGIGVAIIIAIFVLLFRVMILMVLPYSTGKLIYKLIIPPVIFIVLFFTVRGGTQQMPINESFASYSDIKFINDVSINPAWHLVHMTMAAIEEKQDDKLKNEK
ncbi:MAG TPA: hypothetical protein VII99_07625 [Bacteroidia bacterium]